MSLTVPPSSTSRQTRRWPVIFALLIAILLIAIAAGVVLQDDDNGTASPTGPSVSTTPLEPVQWKPSMSQLPTLPFSPTYGPRSHQAGIATGFAHNESGAVSAALHLSYEVSGLAGPDVYRRAWTERFLGDTARFLTFTEQTYADYAKQQGVAYGSPLTAPAATPVFQGYVIRSGDPTGEAVTIQLVNRTPSTSGAPSYSVAQVVLRWHNEDWLGVPDETPIAPITEPPADMRHLS